MNPDSPQPASSPAVRLLPLVEGSSNEGLANALARLLVENEEQAEMGARGALLILTGIQTFIDSGGDYLKVEHLWEPCIVARHMEFAHGETAWIKACEMAEAARTCGDDRGTAIYERVAVILSPDAHKPVDEADVNKKVDETS